MVESFKTDAYVRINGLLALPGIDIEMKKQQDGKENASEVVDTFSICEDLRKPIEQVGSAYEKLKVRVHKQHLKAATNHKN